MIFLLAFLSIKSIACINNVSCEAYIARESCLSAKSVENCAHLPLLGCNNRKSCICLDGLKIGAIDVVQNADGSCSLSENVLKRNLLESEKATQIEEARKSAEEYKKIIKSLSEDNALRVKAGLQEIQK